MALLSCPVIQVHVHACVGQWSRVAFLPFFGNEKEALFHKGSGLGHGITRHFLVNQIDVLQCNEMVVHRIRDLLRCLLVHCVWLFTGGELIWSIYMLETQIRGSGAEHVCIWCQSRKHIYRHMFALRPERTPLSTCKHTSRSSRTTTDDDPKVASNGSSDTGHSNSILIQQLVPTNGAACGLRSPYCSDRGHDRVDIHYIQVYCVHQCQLSSETPAYR